MERAGRLIAGLKLPLGSVSLEELACKAWPAAVGKRIASHTRAVSLTGGRLVVDVEDAIWQRQLLSLKGQLLKRLEAVLGDETVGNIEFRLAIPRRLPQRAECPKAVKDDADCIEDPVLRIIYKEMRKKESA
jgi:predicted nucleic acid-binding Zn ribbon protein